MKKIKQHFIEYCNVLLPIITCDDGNDRVPFKSLSDAIGVNWQSQKRKIIKNEYLFSRYGLILGGDIPPQNPQKHDLKKQYLIRIDRIHGFLFNLNPESISNHGNTDSAIWLIKKHDEWSDALHSYEQYGIAIKAVNSQFRKELRILETIKEPLSRQVFIRSLNEDYGGSLFIPEQQQIPM